MYKKLTLIASNIALLSSLSFAVQADNGHAAPTPMPTQAPNQTMPMPYPNNGPMNFNSRNMPFNGNNMPWNNNGGNRWGGNNMPWNGNNGWSNNMPWNNNGGNNWGGFNMPWNNNNGWGGNNMPWSNNGGNNWGGFNMPWNNNNGWGNRNSRMPWGGNSMPWGNNTVPFNSNFTPWSEQFWDGVGQNSENPFNNAQSWMQPGDPKGSMVRAWDDMLDAPNKMGTMPGGWKAPSISVPNPVEVGDEFGNAMKDLPNQMDNFNTNFR